MQSRCDVEVYTPVREYSEVTLLGPRGEVLDSTLSVRNDSVRFSRTDSLSMPYVATLRLRNPSSAELDAVYMPLVIEGGTVRVGLTESDITLTGTPGNERLLKYVKAKLRFESDYSRGGNPGHDVERLRADYSRFFSDQILANRGTVVGDYILETTRQFLTPEDLRRVREADAG